MANFAKTMGFSGRSKPIRIGSEVPNFDAESTQYSVNGQKIRGGHLNFHSYIDGSWAVLFSHPCNSTPVCATEIASFAEKQNEFDKRDVRLIGLSIGNLKSHESWISEIESNLLENCSIKFPIIAANRTLAEKLDMMDKDKTPTDERPNGCPEKWHTIRSVFVINPKKEVRAILSYPMETGRNIKEIIRLIDSLQAHYDTGKIIVTPADWKPGKHVLFRPKDSTEISKLFTDVIPTKLSYMTFKPLSEYQLRGFRKNPLQESFAKRRLLESRIRLLWDILTRLSYTNDSFRSVIEKPLYIWFGLVVRCKDEGEFERVGLWEYDGEDELYDNLPNGYSAKKSHAMFESLERETVVLV